MPLDIVVPEAESYNEATNEFINTKEQVLRLEHSLISVQKWEAKWHKAFLNPKNKKTNEEVLDYIRCMTITQNVDPNVYLHLTQENFADIQKYIDDPHTATVINDLPGRKPNQDVFTNELIYYYMISNNIPLEFEKRHLNHLMTLLNVFAHKNTPPKKMSKGDIMRRNTSLNAARRAALHSTG